MIVKSDAEIRALREGGRRLAEVLEEVGKRVRPGVTARELDEYARQLMREKGGTPSFLDHKPSRETRAFPAALCVSVNEEIVHGIPNEREKILKEGDLVTLDGGFIYEGLYTDAAVSFAVGTIDAKGKRLIAAVNEALDAAIAAVHAGARTGDVGEAVSAVAKKYGYSVPRELAGHGVGRAVHEEPSVPNIGKRGRGERLTEGMVIAIEPMFAEGKPAIELAEDQFTIRMRDGSRSAHAEHTLIVTKDGAEIVTKL